MVSAYGGRVECGNGGLGLGGINYTSRPLLKDENCFPNFRCVCIFTPLMRRLATAELDTFWSNVKERNHQEALTFIYVFVCEYT